MGVACFSCCHQDERIKALAKELSDRPQRPRKDTKQILLITDLQSDFREVAGSTEESLHSHTQLAAIWKKCAERRQGELLDVDEHLIEKSAKDYFQLLDIYHNEKVTYEEFIAFMLGGNDAGNGLKGVRNELNENLKRDPKMLKELIRCFHDWDRDGDGYITQEDLESRFSQMERAITGVTRQKTWKPGDLKGDLLQEADLLDGKLSLWDFIAHTMGRRKTPVELLLYDISKGAATALGPLLFGRRIDAVHSSVLVFDREYWYGGRILISRPPCEEQFGSPLRQAAVQLEQSECHPGLNVVRIGYTMATKQELTAFLDSISLEWTGMEQYDLLTHSCNHFSNEIINFLTGGEVPAKLLELQKIALTPAIRAMRPFLNKWLGGFNDCRVKDDVMTAVATTTSNVDTICHAVLGEGELVLVEDIEGVEGNSKSMVAAIQAVAGENGDMCSLRYFDPMTGKLEVKLRPRDSVKRRPMTCKPEAFPAFHHVSDIILDL